MMTVTRMKTNDGHPWHFRRSMGNEYPWCYGHSEDLFDGIAIGVFFAIKLGKSEWTCVREIDESSQRLLHTDRDPNHSEPGDARTR